MNFQPKCLATAIGSLPHPDPEKAVQVVLDSIPDCPIWPQLPARGMNEQMEIQYSEGMPCVVIDRDKERMYMDTSDDTFAGISEFMSLYAMDEVDAFAISPEYAAGFYAMEKALQQEPGKRSYVKVQTTGPISFGLTIVDENKRAIYYNDIYRDAVVKALAMKCRWQIRRYRQFADKVICFIDEPILSAFGSSTYLSVSREDVVSILNEVIEAVHSEGAIAGIHCCGNTEWPILIDAGVDVVNFDAFDYGDTVALYPEAMKRHVDSGKVLAWGVVPTNSEKIAGQSVESLAQVFGDRVDNLAKATGLDRQQIIQQAMVTPSCGTGSLPINDAEKVFDLLGKLSKYLMGA